MRKLVWFVAFAAIAGGVAIYFTAASAAHNPDSWLGRTAGATAELGMRCNPFVAVNRLLTTPVNEPVCDGLANGRCNPACDNRRVVEEEAPQRVERPLADELEAAEIAEPIQVEGVQPQRAGIADLNDEQLEDLVGSLIPCLRVSRSDSDPEVAGREEANEAPTMIVPFCPESDVPATMPYAEDDAPSQDQAQSCTGWFACTGWFGWFVEFRQGVKPCHEREAGTEKPMKGDDEEGEQEKTPDVDQYRDPHHHHSCPYMRCPHPYYPPPRSCTPERKEEPTKGASEENSMQDTITVWKKLMSGWLWKRLGRITQDNRPAQRGVDTMECRPSDIDY